MTTAQAGVLIDDDQRLATSNMSRHPQAIPATTAQIPSNRALQATVCSYWHERLSHHHHASELLDEVACHFNIDSMVIIGWVNLNNWLRPEDEGTEPQIDNDDDYFSAGSEWLFTKKFIDRRMVEDDLRDLAVDPLYPFWANLRNQCRRPAMTWLEAMGQVRPGDVDLDEAQHLLNQYPFTIEQLSAIYAIDRQVFRTYCNYYNLTEQRHAGALDLTLGQLVLQDRELQDIVVRNAQWLYHRNAIPIHRLARFCNLQWEDLWAMGTRDGCWVLPNDERLREVEYLVINHKL